MSAPRRKKKTPAAAPKPKEYVIEIGRTKSRDGWIATVDKVGVRVEAPSYQAVFVAAFKALEDHKPRLKLIDNVDVRLKVAARKRQLVERVQPACNAAAFAFAKALKAQREFLRAGRKAAEALREDGFSKSDLAGITLNSPLIVQRWMVDDGDEAKRAYADEIDVSAWLTAQAYEILMYANERYDGERAKPRAKKGAKKS